MASLRHRTISGIFWSLLQNLGGGGISFIVTIILARILTPEMFGLIGMLAIFIQVSHTLVVAGFNQALIQKKNVDEDEFSSVFWLNLSLSVLIYAILFFLAPFIADFYHHPILTKLTRVVSLVFIVNAFSYVQEARLRKEMQFRALTIIHIPSIAIAGVTSVIMAVLGCGVWSIIAMELVSRFAYAIQIWIYSRWKPLFVFDREKTKKLFSFGGKLMLSDLLNSVYQNIYLVIIGKFFPLGSVGYYQTAGKVVKTPSTTLSNALTSVVFPAFSSVQEDKKKLKEGYKKIVEQVLFWICPVFILSAVLGVPLFRFVFGEKWLPSVPFFRLLCISGIVYPLNSYNLTIVNVKGRSDISLNLEIVKKIITSVGILVALPFGIWALVTFQAINSVFACFLNSYFSGRFIAYPIIEQLKDILPIIGISLISGATVFFVDYLLVGFPDWIRLLVGYGVGGGIYWFIAWLSDFSPYLDFVGILKAKMSHFYLEGKKVNYQ